MHWGSFPRDYMVEILKYTKINKSEVERVGLNVTEYGSFSSSHGSDG